MGFKLGKGRTPIASQGEIRTKMRFGKESGDADASVPGTPVIRKSLDPGIMGEANMDGSIFISDQLIPGSFEERQVINHEMRYPMQTITLCITVIDSTEKLLTVEI